MGGIGWPTLSKGSKPQANPPRKNVKKRAATVLVLILYVPEAPFDYATRLAGKGFHVLAHRRGGVDLIQFRGQLFDPLPLGLRQVFRNLKLNLDVKVAIALTALSG